MLFHKLRSKSNKLKTPGRKTKGNSVSHSRELFRKNPKPHQDRELRMVAQKFGQNRLIKLRIFSRNDNVET